MSLWFQKPLKVGKTERYSIDVSGFADGQAITSATFASNNTLTTVGTTDIDGTTLSALVTGNTTGLESISVNYGTTDRSDCQMINLDVIDGC